MGELRKKAVTAYRAKSELDGITVHSSVFHYLVERVEQVYREEHSEESNAGGWKTKMYGLGKFKDYQYDLSYSIQKKLGDLQPEVIIKSSTLYNYSSTFHHLKGAGQHVPLNRKRWLRQLCRYIDEKGFPDFLESENTIKVLGRTAIDQQYKLILGEAYEEKNLHQIYISTPMTSISPERAEEDLVHLKKLIDYLKDSLDLEGDQVYCAATEAGRDFSQKLPQQTVGKSLSALGKTKKFILFYFPDEDDKKRAPSSTLIEAGWAIQLNIVSRIYTPSEDLLPNILRGYAKNSGENFIIERRSNLEEAVDTIMKYGLD